MQSHPGVILGIMYGIVLHLKRLSIWVCSCTKVAIRTVWEEWKDSHFPMQAPVWEVNWRFCACGNVPVGAGAGTWTGRAVPPVTCVTRPKWARWKSGPASAAATTSASDSSTRSESSPMMNMMRWVCPSRPSVWQHCFWICNPEFLSWHLWNWRVMDERALDPVLCYLLIRGFRESYLGWVLIKGWPIRLWPSWLMECAEAREAHPDFWRLSRFHILSQQIRTNFRCIEERGEIAYPKDEAYGTILLGCL